MKKTLIMILITLSIFLISCSSTDGLNKKDLMINIGSSEYALDSDASILVSDLGDSYVFSEAPSCVYDGKDKIYSYENIEIYTYPLNGKDLIDEVVFLTSGYSTNKGVKIGDSLEMVKKAYGENYTYDGSVLIYSSDLEKANSPQIYFVINNDKVTSIHYYSASNILTE